MENPDNQNAGCGGNVVIDHMALEWVLSQFRGNVVAGNAERWRIGQKAESVVNSFQVVLALFAAPLPFCESGDILKVCLGGVGQRK